VVRHFEGLVTQIFCLTGGFGFAKIFSRVPIWGTPLAYYLEAVSKRLFFAEGKKNRPERGEKFLKFSHDIYLGGINV